MTDRRERHGRHWDTDLRSWNGPRNSDTELWSHVDHEILIETDLLTQKKLRRRTVKPVKTRYTDRDRAIDPKKCRLRNVNPVKPRDTDRDRAIDPKVQTAKCESSYTTRYWSRQSIWPKSADSEMWSQLNHEILSRQSNGPQSSESELRRPNHETVRKKNCVNVHVSAKRVNSARSGRMLKGKT